MKLPLALACLALGVISAVLVGQGDRPQPRPAGPDLPGLVGNDVTYGRDGLNLPAEPPTPGWGSLPMPQPDMLRPSGRPPTATMLGRDDPLARLQAMPAAYRPMPFQADKGAALISLSKRIELANVPEPGTWLMMISGLGLVGLGARRHHSGGHLATL